MRNDGGGDKTWGKIAAKCRGLQLSARLFLFCRQLNSVAVFSVATVGPFQRKKYHTKWVVSFYKGTSVTILKLCTLK
jgi:hypothetical protein